MEQPVIAERRLEPRTTVARTLASRARLRPGRTAVVLNLSAGGALVETEWRLLPGMRVELQIGDPTLGIHVAGRVLRCHVSSLTRERVCYCGALAFEKLVPFGAVSTPIFRK